MSSKERRSSAKAQGRRFSLPERPGENVNVIVASALEAHQAGRFDEAEALYAKALAADPDHVDALSLSGALVFTRGRIDEAIRRISRAVRLRPDHNDARLNLAEALEAAGRIPEALDACRKAISIAPDCVDAHARLSRLLALRNESALALAHARVALALEPDCVQALVGGGLALRLMKRWIEAESYFRLAVASAPDDLGALTGLASVLHETARFEETIELYRRAAEIKVNEPGLFASIGDALERSGDGEGAMVYYRRALELNPTSPDLLYRCGECLRNCGRFDQAEAEYQAVLARQPAYSPALRALIRIGRLKDSLEVRKRLTRTLSDKSSPALFRVQAGLACGELMERAGEYDEAFGKYAEANALHKQCQISRGDRFNQQDLDDSIDLLEQRVAAEFAHDVKGWAVDTELPVFVVGPSRSGTTLVEQICASHSKVTGAGELRSIQTAAEAISFRNRGVGKISDWDADDARAQAEKHAAWLERLADGASRVVDKTPFNLTRLGYIAAMFPRAKVIRCRRDLRDAGVSNHTMFFNGGNVWATDLRECGHFLRQSERLGDIWAKTLDLPILEVVYEDLVTDLETHVRRIIDFLDLEWEPKCLRFYETDRHVDTPSAWQVRQPIYSRSVGRWRRFERHLGPLFDALAGED